MRRSAGLWRKRLATARAGAVLSAAQILVKATSLGTVRTVLTRISTQRTPPSPASLQRARAVGRRVERSAMRLPFTTRCLSRAIAAKWLLDRDGTAARLVIAVHRRDRSGEHAFHAWVEHGDEIVIGHCVRADYAPVMSID